MRVFLHIINIVIGKCLWPERRLKTQSVTCGPGIEECRPHAICCHAPTAPLLFSLILPLECLVHSLPSLLSLVALPLRHQSTNTQ